MPPFAARKPLAVSPFTSLTSSLRTLNGEIGSLEKLISQEPKEIVYLPCESNLNGNDSWESQKRVQKRMFLMLELCKIVKLSWENLMIDVIDGMEGVEVRDGG